MKNWFLKDDADGSSNPKSAYTRAIWFSIPLALMGLFALVLLAHDGLLPLFGQNPHWGLNQKITFTLASAVIASGCFIGLIFSVAAKKQAMKAGAKKSSNDEKPWLKRADWAAGRVTSGTRKNVFFVWFFTIFWNAACLPILFAGLPAELHKGNDAILIALLFPVIGVGMIVFALKTTLAWRRFGRSIFEMAAIPGALGGTLEGEIRVGQRLRPEHGLHLRLSCIRRTTSGGGNNRTTTEKILWQDEKWLRDDLPQTDANATGIPVFFKLPGSLPESTLGGGDGIHWRLETSATLRGPNFQAAFEVPVFRLAEVPASSDDPTAPYQMSLDEVRKKIHSKIQINDLPDGREFIFPAGRNPGFAAAMTFFPLVFGGATVLLLHFKAPILFPVIFAPVTLLLAAVAFNVWFLRSRVLATNRQLKIELTRLFFKNEYCWDASDVATISVDVGASAGHTAYYDLKIIGHNGKEFAAAKSLNSKPEADWIAREMAAALKKP